VGGVTMLREYIFGSIGGGLTDIQGLLGDTPSTYNATIYGIVRAMFVTHIILTTYMLFRFMEIYLTISLAPIPMATFGSKEYSRMGEGFIKTLLSYALQVFLIILAITIYTGLINVTIGGMIASGEYDGMATIQLLAITIIMVMMITKTKSLAREILG
jgi:type IV secretory pathway TrbL component